MRIGQDLWDCLSSRQEPVARFTQTVMPRRNKSAVRWAVQYVLEGSVRGGSERIRVTAQLTDGTSGQVLWTEQYDRVIDDSFVVQDEIAQKIITSMDVKLVRRRTSQSLAQGRYEIRRRWSSIIAR